MNEVYNKPGTLIVVGAGPGIGAAVARRFGREGFAAGLIARNRARLDVLVSDLEAEGIRAAAATADARQPAQIQEALRQLAAQLGPVGVLCFSPLPDIGLIKPVLETSADDLIASLELNVGGAAAAALAVLPSMREQGHGTLLFTTGSAGLNPNQERASSGVTTNAETLYLQMLHDALAGEGIHVAHVVIVGPIGEGKKHEPDAVAEHLWQRYRNQGEITSVLR